MSDDSLERLKRLFDAAQLHAPEDRSAFLDAVCADDPALRQELDSLLEADDQAEAQAFLQQPVSGWPTSLLGDLGGAAEDELIGQHVGPYVVQRHLGQGGMGDVYLALREQPFKQYVALKIIRGGMNRREVLARFAVERQILASLNHPNIARLLDGGVTADGLPYFAMEYVKGRPITRYCDENKLPLRAWLRLFQQVCQAVQYAHQNLIIHRDLKPSNILVTETGTIKLLDFGIAKLLNPSMSPVAQPVTRVELRLMTPEYASPEQVRNEQLTTASDVYSLGVILYELLTGHRPYRVAGRPTQEIIEIVCEQDPPAPSVQISKAETLERSDGSEREITPEEVGAKRGTQPERLRRQVRGDLDTIVLMALRKEASRRYGSSEQLEQDIERYLTGLPIVARPNTVRYRLHKLLVRHRAAAVAAVLVVLSLVVGTSAALWQAERARTERDRARTEAQKAEQARVQAEAVTNFLTGLFEANTPQENHGDDLTARELLERGTERIEQLSDQASVQAQLLSVIGMVYQSMGQYDDAQQLLEQALFLRREEFGEQSPEVAESLNDVGFAHYLKGDYDAAQPYLQKALTLRRGFSADGHDPLEVAESLNLLAAIELRQGDYDAAESLYREALAVRRKLLGERHADVATSMNNLARLLRLKGDYDEAEGLLNEALSQWQEF
ncbi:MAG: serine/threonine-protein kinase, partial [Acidiferrobacterales bacterium]|nr:serine/threonine-protein kinase [Acidiferrobacterales bacterium]